MKVSENLWSQMVAAFDAAAAKADEAQTVYEKVPLPDNDAGEKSSEEKAWEEASAAETAEENRLLGVEAPHPAGAALQLRIFARRYFSVDLATQQTGAEDPEGAILRRIYSALTAGCARPS